jgi:membrane protease YdiL (CAAX protease family)
MPLWQIAFVLLGAPALQWLLFVASGVTFATFSRFAFLAGMLTEYIAFAFVLLILRRAGMRLSDIGLNAERWGRDTLVGIGAGVVLFVVSGVLMVVIEPILPSTLSRDPRPPWAAVVYAFALLTAFAPIEEIVWRGYAIKSLTQHLRSTGAAVLIASVAFGLMHWWGGPAHVVIASIVGIAFSGLYLWRRSLVANIVAHFVLDFPLVLFMLFPVEPPS